MLDDTQQTASKVEFIKAHPTSTSAGDVVRAARAAGLTVSASYVYAVRRQSRQARGTKRAQARRAARETTVSASARRAELERQLAALIDELVAARVDELRERARAEIARALGKA